MCSSHAELALSLLQVFLIPSQCFAVPPCRYDLVDAHAIVVDAADDVAAGTAVVSVVVSAAVIAVTIGSMATIIVAIVVIVILVVVVVPMFDGMIPAPGPRWGISTCWFYVDGGQ